MDLAGQILQIDELGDALFGESDELVELLFGKRRALCSALNFDNPAGTGHDKVRIGFRFGILVIVEVQNRCAFKNTAGDCCDIVLQHIAADHLARLQTLQNEGRLLLAGPHPAVDAADPGSAGFSGSLVVAEFASLEQAQAWADADPYVAAGVYQQVTVKPFKRVFPA